MRRICRPIVRNLYKFAMPLMLALGAHGVALAQDSPPASGYGDHFQPAITPDQAVVIRDSLRNILSSTGAIAQLRGEIQFVESTDFALGLLDMLSDEELGVYVELLPQLFRMSESLDLLEEEERIAAADRQGAPSETHRGHSHPSASSATLPNADHSGPCGPPRDSLKGFLIGLQVGEGIWIAADHACNFSWTIGFPCFPPFNFNTSLACIVADVAFGVPKYLFQQEAFCNGRINSAEILGLYNRLEHIHNDLHVFRTTSYTEAESNSSIATNNRVIVKFRDDVIAQWDAFVLRILGIIAELKKEIEQLIMDEFDSQNLELRTFRARVGRLFIGEDLSSVSSLGRIGFYQLPGSFVCPNAVSTANTEPFVCPDLATTVPCGGLEHVQKTVEETIAMMKAAGQNVFDAPGLKAKGDHEFANGNYRVAHDFYSQAYRMATSLNGSG